MQPVIVNQPHPLKDTSLLGHKMLAKGDLPATACVVVTLWISGGVLPQGPAGQPAPLTSTKNKPKCRAEVYLTGGGENFC